MEAPKDDIQVSGSQFNSELLMQYYKHLFPAEMLFRWLSYGGSRSGAWGKEKGGEGKWKSSEDYFQHREICFTLEDDIYIRYQCFQDGDALGRELVKRVPHKIDIGAVFSYPPKKHNTVKASKFKPLERELVFDIDLTDYDEVGAKGADIAHGMGADVWYFMAASIKVLDRALREDLGFKHLLWIFSGRRGVHCWVCDKKARQLEDSARKAIVQYLSVVTGAEGPEAQAPVTYPLHPLLEKCFPELEAMFLKHVVGKTGQGLLADGNTDGWKSILKHIPSEETQENLLQTWAKSSMTPEERWQQLKLTTEAVAKRQVKAQGRAAKYQDAKALMMSAKSIVMLFVYPRLDINVSTHRNHLLKSPWCVHPKTGRLCVPIDPKQADDFNPHAVPTLVSIFQDIEDFAGEKEDAADDDGNMEGAPKRRRIDDASKTRMAPYLRYFESHFLEPLLASCARDSAAPDAAAPAVPLVSSVNRPMGQSEIA